MSGASGVTSCSAGARIASSLEQGVNLAGSIAADPATAYLGEAVTLHYTVQNVGNAALDPANIEILIVAPETGDVLARLADSPVLAPGVAYASTQPAPSLAVGTYVAVLRAGPGNDLRTLASAPLTILEPPNQPPVCDSAAATMPSLWPPNHKYALVGVRGVTDPNGDPVTIRILGVTQDEGVLEAGSGNTCPDAIVKGDSVQIRAERSVHLRARAARDELRRRYA